MSTAVDRMPGQLDRRFEAVVLVGDVVDDPAGAADALRRVGVAVVTLPATTADGGGDAVLRACERLWREGIGFRSVLVVADGRGSDGSAAEPLLHADLSALAPTDLDARTLPPDVTGVVGGRAGVRALLADQVRRREEGDVPAAVAEPGWGFEVEGFEPERERVHEALLALADGRLGTSGAPLLEAPGVERWVLANGAYVGHGAETRLLTVPAAFHLPRALPTGADLRRLLDLRTGVVHEEVTIEGFRLWSVRFVSMARPGTIVLRARSSRELPLAPTLVAPEDDRALDEGAIDGVAWMRVAGDGGSAVTAAAEERRPAGDGWLLDRVAVSEAGEAQVPDPAPAVSRARAAAATGFDALLDEHRRAWASR